MIHRGFGTLTALVTIAIAIAIWRRAAATPVLRWTSAAAALLVLVQIGLGVYTVLSLRAPPVAVAHFAGAAGLWGLWVSMWLYTGRVPVALTTAESRRHASVPPARALPTGAR
jgi:heme A synthase